ncbi:MAG: aldo/keto reductase [Candidatus Sumerlaeia bacterium]|nr:aldo/keto reductase [Candidatus Sumerlaeia bacterium]
MIPGRATPEGTAAFAARHAALGPHAHGALGSTELTVSGAGFGCYRIHDANAQHAAALRLALRSGVNLIDTSTNYTGGASERLVGRVLAEAIAAGDVQREEVVLVTKTGYLQGENHAVAVRREEEGRPFPEVVKLGPDLWHCIHPEFLADQIGRSLGRMGVETIDVFLLHNPEYYLEAARMSGRRIAAVRDEYHRRIEEAFRHLETEVSRGRIARFGISSNTFPEAPHGPKFTSLERCWESAGRAGAEPHFSVIQLPGNLVEAGLARVKNQREGTQTVLDFAQEKGLGVLVNRPLNAFTGQEMIRLAEYPTETEGTADAVRERIADLVRIESELPAQLPGPLRGSEREPGPVQLLIAGVFLRANWTAFSSRDHWQDFVGHRLIPQTQHGLSLLPGDPAAQAWRERYAGAVNAAISALRDFLSAGDNGRAETFRKEVHAHLPPQAQSLPLSQLAVWALRVLPAVSSVLVGMRREAYVRDVLAALAVSPEGGEAVWDAL